MNLDVIKPALVDLTQTLAGDGVAVRWEDQPRGYIPPGSRAEALLSLRSVVRVGTDTYKDVDLTTLGPQPAGQEIQRTLYGVRLVTFRVKVESLEQGDLTDAVYYAEKVRDGVELPSSREALHAADMALVSELALERLDYKVDDRIKSVAALDLRLRVAVTQADPVRVGYIANVGLTHTLAGEQP